MSIFPTKVLLATDGSREAELAASTAADLARSTGSELHVLYVGEAANPYVDVVVERAGDEAVPRYRDVLASGRRGSLQGEASSGRRLERTRVHTGPGSYGVPALVLRGGNGGGGHGSPVALRR